MSYYTVTLALSGPLAAAVAVEWTNEAAPTDSGQGWEPCLRQPDGTWRFASHEPATARHLRSPGRFGDLAIRYRLEPAGPWSAASAGRKEIVILEVAPGGEGDGEALLAAPAVGILPSLAGTGVIGTELALDPGTWTGAPAPALAFQWRRDGAAIAGATARAYAPAAADDGCALDCLVTAASALGRAEAATAAVVVRYAPPRLRAELPEEVFDQGEGVEIVETAAAFEGENLTFSAEGFAIDPETGALSLPVGAPVSGGAVTITAANSGGSAAAVLRYTVEAATPRTLGAADVTIQRSLWLPAGQVATFSPEIAFPGLAAETVQAIEFTVDAPDTAAPAWRPLRLDAGVWRPYDSAEAAEPRVWDPATPRSGRLRFRWRMAQAGPWSAESPAFDVPEPAADYTVSTAADLLARMQSATPGQVIACRGGAYDGIEKDNLRNTGAQILIRPVDRSNPPVFPRMRVTGIRGFVLDGLRFLNTVMDANFPAYPAGSATAFRADNCVDLTLRNCVFENFHVSFSSSIGSQRLLIEWCHFTRCGMDSLRAFGAHKNLVIRNNLFDNPNVDTARSNDADRHPDFIQFAVNAPQLPAENVLVENNQLSTLNGYHQGIFVKNARVVVDGEDLATYGFRNITVRGNWIRSRHAHAIALGGVNDLLVEDNLIQPLDLGGQQAWTTEAKGVPRISLLSPYNNGIIRNNVMAGDFNLWENGSLADIQVSANQVTTSPEARPKDWTFPKTGPYGYEA